LRVFHHILIETYGGKISRMKRILPGLYGTGFGGAGDRPETADSILLYALGKPVFVVDAYTKAHPFETWNHSKGFYEEVNSSSWIPSPADERLLMNICPSRLSREEGLQKDSEM